MKTKLYKQLLVAALSLLLVVPAFADEVVNSTITLHVETAPEPGFSSVYGWNQTRYETYYFYEGDSTVINYVEGQIEQIWMEVYERDNWAFVNWTDANGNVLGTESSTTITINAPGTYWFYANFRFNPRNPGFLPMGTYDLATGTLTIYNPQGTNTIWQNYFALASKYNLSAREKQDYYSQSNYNPVYTVRVEGYLDDAYSVNEVANMSGGTVRTIDLTGLQHIEDQYFNTYYLLAWNDSVNTVSLPAWITNIDSYTFVNARGLRDIYLYATEVPWLADNAIIYDDGETPDSAVITVHVPAEALTTYLADTLWASKFNIVAMATSTTANVVVYPELIEEGEYLTISQIGDSTGVRIPLNAGQMRYELPNLLIGGTYLLTLNTVNNFGMDVAMFTLNADTTIYLTNATPLGTIPARVFVDTVEITDKCLVTWLNTQGNNVLGTGAISPLLPMQYETKINVTPMGELATYILPKDTFAINAPGHNGVWITLDQKPVGGQDTVRVETGTVIVTIAGDVENTVGLLYDSIGNLLGKSSVQQLNLGAVIALPGMPVGCYSVVLMREGKYSTLSRLDLYQQMGLVENTDYVREDFCIVANQVTNVNIAGIPAEPQITNFLGPNAHFYANKTEVMVAGQLILTAEVDFLEEYRADISNVYYVIDLPENVQLVENSVMVGSSTVSYSFQEGQLRVGVGLANLANINATALRFCVAPMAEGDYYPSAAVEFNYRGQAKAQPIGNTFFQAKSITIQSPAYVVQPAVTVTGFAPAYANVSIKTAENETIGTGTTNALGKYTILCTFTASGSRTLVLHAEASTDIISGLVSDTCSTYYDAEAAAPTEIQMTHYNKWYKKNMTIIWNLTNCTTNEKYYYYYLDADFTFRVHMQGDVDTVAFVAIGQDGSRTTIPAYRGTAGDWWATRYIQTYKVPVRVDLVYGNDSTLATYENCKSVGAIADPSGYVYEAVSSNRLEGVTAAAYMKMDEADMPVLWDAEPYDQVNPMLTDEAGGYAWDVPSALWQVRFSKAGYEPAQTNWLPVPPPQMEVNMPLVRLSEPTLKAVNAYIDNLVIEFDRYMIPEDLGATKIQITDGENEIAGAFTLLDREARFSGDTVFFASKVKFLPSASFQSSSLAVNINGARSYAGVPMTASQNVNVVAEIKNFGNIDTIKLTVGEAVSREFFALPQAASAGKTMTVENTGEIVALAVNTAVIGNNGGALFAFTGMMPGSTEVRVAIPGTDLEVYVPVVVVAQEGPITSVEDVIADEPQQVELKAEKILLDGQFYIDLNGARYTATGIQVK